MRFLNFAIDAACIVVVVANVATCVAPALKHREKRSTTRSPFGSIFKQKPCSLSSRTNFLVVDKIEIEQQRQKLQQQQREKERKRERERVREREREIYIYIYIYI